MPDPQAGELAAFVHQEHRRLVGLLALQVGRITVAEELAQDALIRLCEYWPRVRHMADRRSWLNRVAINLANSWFRDAGTPNGAPTGVTDPANWSTSTRQPT